MSIKAKLLATLPELRQAINSTIDLRERARLTQAIEHVCKAIDQLDSDQLVEYHRNEAVWFANQQTEGNGFDDIDTSCTD